MNVRITVELDEDGKHTCQRVVARLLEDHAELLRKNPNVPRIGHQVYHNPHCMLSWSVET